MSQGDLVIHDFMCLSAVCQRGFFADILDVSNRGHRRNKPSGLGV